jgi:hypothetical protein
VDIKVVITTPQMCQHWQLLRHNLMKTFLAIEAHDTHRN